jgi:hypothetical protein
MKAKNQDIVRPFVVAILVVAIQCLLAVVSNAGLLGDRLKQEIDETYKNTATPVNANVDLNDANALINQFTTANPDGGTTIDYKGLVDALVKTNDAHLAASVLSQLNGKKDTGLGHIIQVSRGVSKEAEGLINTINDAALLQNMKSTTTDRKLTASIDNRISQIDSANANTLIAQFTTTNADGGTTVNDKGLADALTQTKDPQLTASVLTQLNKPGPSGNGLLVWVSRGVNDKAQNLISAISDTALLQGVKEHISEPKMVAAIDHRLNQLGWVQPQ